jgi:hypothetical protein
VNITGGVNMISKFVGKILGFFSNTKLLGFIPLDVVMHLGVSYLIMFIMLAKKVRFLYAYLTVFLLAIAKEVFDSFSLTNTIEENIKDLCVSMVFPTLLLIVWKLLKKKI